MPSLMIDIGASVARLERDVAKANQTIDGFAKSAKTAFGLIAGYLSASSISAAVRNVAAAYMEQERASNKMAQAMKNQGDFSKAALKDMEDYASEIQGTTAVADEAALSAMANLKSYGMLNDEVKRATQVAVDFAAAKREEGMTVVTASELLGKAYVGNTALLGRYGIVISDTLKGSEKFEAVMAQLQARFGGAAQAEMETYEGRIKNLGNAWGDVKETLGALALEIADPLIPLMKDLAKQGMEAAEGINLALSSGAQAKTSRKRMAILDQIHEAEAELKEFRALVELEGGRGTELGILLGGGGSASAAEAQIPMVENRIRQLHEELKNLSIETHKAELEAAKVQPGGKRTVPPPGGDDAEKEREKWLKDYLSGVDRAMKAEQERSELVGELYMLDVKWANEKNEKQQKAEEEYFKTLEDIKVARAEGEAEAREEALKAEEEAAKKTARIWEHTAELMQDNFSSLFLDVMQGKLEGFAEFAKRIFQSIQKAIADYLGQAAMEALFGQEGKGGGWLSSLFKGFSLFNAGGSAAAASGSAMGAGEIAAYASMFHSGGIVGDAVPKRVISASYFHGAPRLHDGLAGDEYPAILQKGERVVSKSDASRKEQAPNFNVVINAVDPVSFAELAARNPQAIIGPFLAALQQGGQVRNAIRSVM